MNQVHQAGPASGTEDLEIDLLLEAVFQRYGHDFRAYERDALKRKIHALMASRSLATISQLQDRTLHEPATLAALLRVLSVQQAYLFDDPQQTHFLRTALATCLRGSALPRVWLPECGGAEEAWALAILLADEQLDARTEIFATVANEELLAASLEASIPADRLPEYQENYLKSGGKARLADYFDIEGKRAVLKAHLRKRIIWAQYNLVTDASFNEFQVIVCRRALADFGPLLRQKTLGLFNDSLALFGMLGLDRELDDSDALQASYVAVFAHQPWYKRVR